MNPPAGLVLAACLAGWSGGFLDRAGAQDKPFTAETRVVEVPVTVTDDRGHNVEGLTAADFRLLDNGISRKFALDLADTGVAPVSLVVAIQSSEISAAALTKLRRIGSLLQPLVTGERGAVAVVTFDKDIHWLQDFTSDPDEIRRAFVSIQYGGGKSGRMYDAVIEASDRMRYRKGRKIILLISESRDRSSQAKLSDAVDMALAEGVQVFGAKYSAYSTPFTVKPEELPPVTHENDMLSGLIVGAMELSRMAKTNSVQALAAATGGEEFSFTLERSLEKAIEKFGAEIHSQYILSFALESGRDNRLAGAHRLEASVLDRAGLRVRFRRGYWQE